MSNTLTIRLPEEILQRLKETSRQTGIPLGRLVLQSLAATLSPSPATPLLKFARREEDRHPDLVALCLSRMRELYPKHCVSTVDEADFRVYRRNKREVIPTICPPS